MSQAAFDLPVGSVWLCSACRHNSVTIKDPNSVATNDTAFIVILNQNREMFRSQISLNPFVLTIAVVTGKCVYSFRGNKIIDGKSCDFDHPKPCFKFCAHGDKGKKGYKKDDDCGYYHSIICKFSKRPRKCTNDDCTYVHLRGTK